MATPFEALQNKRKLMEETLSGSSTAYARNVAPTSGDLSAAAQLASVNKQIETLKSEQLRKQWYGAEETPVEETGRSDSFFLKGLKALSRPLSAIAGSAQYVLGKGTESSLAGNINAAMRTGVTFGNILNQMGVPRGVQVPLGLALDVMFDPVNWATAGTAALIPRLGFGLVKGGIKGGVKGSVEATTAGLASNLGKKVATTMKFVPFVKKMAAFEPAVAKEGSKLAFGDQYRNLLTKGASKYTGLTERITQKTLSGAEKYDILTGKTVYDKLNKGIFGMPSGVIGKTAEEFVRKVPSVNILGKMTPTGDQIADFFKYSTKQAADIADLKDKVINLAKNKGVILVRSEAGANFQSIDEFLKPDAVISLKNKIGETMQVAIRNADGSLKPDYVRAIKVHDTLDNARALLDVAGDDYNIKNLMQAYKTTSIGKTGVQWYDNVVDRLKNMTVDDILHARLGPVNITKKVQSEANDLVKTWNSYEGIKDLKPLQRLLTAQQSFISLFKSAKVPMNVSSHVVANIGNFFMGAMMGLPVWKPGYLSAMVRANLLIKGKLGAAGFKELFYSDVNSLINLADENPTRFKQLTGMDPREIASKLSTEEKITRVLSPKSQAGEIKRVLEKAWESVDEGIAQGEKLSSFERVAGEAARVEAESKINLKAVRGAMGRFETPSEQTARMLKESPVRRAEEIGSWTAAELTPNVRLDQMKRWLAVETAKRPYNLPVRLANGLVNSMPRWYEHIDQTFKIGTADYLTKIGLTESELIQVSRTVSLIKKDILEPVLKGGEKLYRLTPLKAAEVATEAFMNYAAMPDFVRVMRALPIVGSPFMSFPYAMAVKTAKTVINNPALFNKVGFMIDEMNTGRTPQEKAAMEEKYNQYLKSPTVMKVMGMWNTNVKNYIPYYTMNMFNPSERTYDESMTQGKILKAFDKFPIFQEPVGQVLKDYFIQPWVLSGTGQTTQGQFGQPLFPSYDAEGKKIKVGLGTKAFYGSRSIAESVVPGALSYIGLAGRFMTPEQIEYLPSYGMRNIAGATQGRSTIGAMTKEDAVRKTLRALLGRTGIPAYTLDTTKTTTPKK